MAQALCHRLEAGVLAAEIVPEIGGSVAAFFSPDTPTRKRLDWFRAADAVALDSRAPTGLASFPLLPWCNRIRDGRFTWRGRVVQLAPNVPDSPHTIHGIGWQSAWTVEYSDAQRIFLALVEAGEGAWPYPFRAELTYRLDPAGLSIDIVLQNTGTQTMPAGLGNHPYFPHLRDGSGTRVTAFVDAIWQSDNEAMPTTLSSSRPEIAALQTGLRLSDHVLDNNFTGYRRTARIDWPDGRALRIIASAPLDFMVLYSPPKQDLFVLEAVSNCTDWINLLDANAADATPATVGGSALDPGETIQATTRFEPEIGG
ncbi:MAG: aldose 1-epimerase [Pseudomonadota bacterium]|nr:aldose 1-epimerase [Pseudomonadota bacterium]